MKGQEPMTTPNQEASYAAMRARVDAKIASEQRDGAERPDPWWQAPRCPLGHIAASPTTCPTCAAERGRP